MQNKNARQLVQDVYNQLQTCRNDLKQAITSVEKEDNKLQIESTLGALDNAITTANRTLSNYKE